MSEIHKEWTPLGRILILLGISVVCSVLICLALSCNTVEPINIPSMIFSHDYPGKVIVDEGEYLTLLKEHAMMREKLRIIYEEHGISVEE